MVAWGLPISWLSPIGNFIFSPLLSSFLLICSIAFFSELIGLPHGIFDWLIEIMSDIWYWLLKLAPNQVLFGLYAPPVWIITAIAISTTLAITHPAIKVNNYRRLALLSTIFASTILLLWIMTPRSIIKTVPCGTGQVTIMRSHGQTILIDPGAMASTGNGTSWAAYTLMPALISTTGSLKIDHLITLKPSITSFDAIARLVDDAQIGHLYVPAMKGELEGSLKKSFGRLYARIKQRAIPYTRLNQMTTSISCGPVTLQASAGKNTRYQTITYTPLTINLADHQQPIL